MKIGSGRRDEDVLRRIGRGGPPEPAGAFVLDASIGGLVIEDFTPVPLNLEWRLSELTWRQNGVLPFVDGQVPYATNSSGAPAADAAAVLFASCLEAPPRPGPISVVEMGAGSGLFARLFLDEFRDLCRAQRRDFYDRLVFHVIDSSPRTVDHWANIGIFETHQTHVIAHVCDARTPGAAVKAPLRAVFANYILDSLPASCVRKTHDGWEQLCARASIGRSVQLRCYTALALDEIRDSVASDPGSLVPLAPVLETEMQFRPIEGAPAWLPYLAHCADLPDGTAFTCNYGAIEAVEALGTMLEADGFISIRDYGATAEDAASCSGGGDRFGTISAVGLNFVLLENWAAAHGWTMVRREGGENTPRWRLLLLTAAPKVRETFARRIAPPNEEGMIAVDRATQQARNGRPDQALATYRSAIANNPRDWFLIGEAAHFVHGDLHDPDAALELARAALQINPWYVPALWNLAGDCLSALARPAEAHECYLRSLEICAVNADTRLRLAASWLRLEDPAKALDEVARGLATDKACMLRQELLELQSQAITALSIRWTREREAAYRRAQQSQLQS